MDEGSEAAGDVTQHLIDWKNGDASAMSRLFPLVYDQLRAIARRQLRRVPEGGSLETTALVHEVYVKLVDHTRADLTDRNHFYAVASTAMRHILVDHARARTAAKRGGGEAATALDESAAAVDARAAEIVAIDEALARLASLDARLVQIVEMRFFGGMSVEETAAALGVSERTVKRDWRKARAFLVLELTPRTSGS